MTRARFTQVTGLDGVYIARAGKLNCTAIRLRNGDMCLYSPVAGLEGLGDDLSTGLSPICALLAPNHYHNKGLQGHANAFPRASLICSKAAGPRLKKITGLTFEQLDILASQLDETQQVLEPEGLKTGEVWVQVKTPSDTAWIVTDAFSATLNPPGDYATVPTMLKTFPRYGVKDAAVYKEWVNEQVSIAGPTILLSCHGSPVHSPELGTQLIRVMSDTL